jgi:serine/threonine protein kinase
MAPEIHNVEDSGFKVDVYAFGILTYMMLTGVKPFHDTPHLFLLGSAAAAHELESL